MTTEPTAFDVFSATVLEALHRDVREQIVKLAGGKTRFEVVFDEAGMVGVVPSPRKPYEPFLSPMRQTHTLAVLEVPGSLFAALNALLRAALIHDETQYAGRQLPKFYEGRDAIDLDGIAIAPNEARVHKGIMGDIPLDEPSATGMFSGILREVLPATTCAEIVRRTKQVVRVRYEVTLYKSGQLTIQDVSSQVDSSPQSEVEQLRGQLVTMSEQVRILSEENRRLAGVQPQDTLAQVRQSARATVETTMNDLQVRNARYVALLADVLEFAQGHELDFLGRHFFRKERRAGDGPGMFATDVEYRKQLQSARLFDGRGIDDAGPGDERLMPEQANRFRETRDRMVREAHWEVLCFLGRHLAGLLPNPETHSPYGGSGVRGEGTEAFRARLLEYLHEDDRMARRNPGSAPALGPIGEGVPDKP